MVGRREKMIWEDGREKRGDDMGRW